LKCKVALQQQVSGGRKKTFLTSRHSFSKCKPVVAAFAKENFNASKQKGSIPNWRKNAKGVQQKMNHLLERCWNDLI
jgi:hypothetical protein